MIGVTKLTRIAVVMGLLVASGHAFCDEALRMWSDTSGQFRVEATLVEKSETDVKLRKKDGLIVTVPITRLSRTDQSYLADAKRTGGASDPFAGGNPSEMRPSTDNASAVGPSKIMADASGGQYAFLPGSIKLNTPGPNDKVQPLVHAEGDDGLILVTVVHMAAAKVSGATSYLCDLESRTVRDQIAWSEGVRPVYYDVKADRLIAIAGLNASERGTSLVSFKGASGGKTPTEKYRVPLKLSSRDGPQHILANATNATHMALYGLSTIHVFDTISGQKLWDDKASSVSARPSLSPGGRYVAYHGDEVIHIKHVKDGGSVDAITDAGQTALNLAFSPDGKKIAAANVYGSHIWNLATKKKTLQLGSVGPGYVPQWLSNDDLILGGQNYVHLPSEMVVWRYSLSPFLWSTNPMHLTGQHSLVYLDAKRNEFLYLVSVELPHADPMKMVRGESMRQYKAIPKGSEISINVDAPDSVEAEAKDYCIKALERSGWQVVPKAAVTLEARIRTDSPKAVSYRDMRNRSDSGTVNVTPFSFFAEVKQSGQVLWKHEALGRPPTLLRLETGETVQQAADRYNTPSLTFFRLLVVPAAILKPEFAKGFGRSKLTMDGIQ